MSDTLNFTDRFYTRHIGITPDDEAVMLKTLNLKNSDELISKVIPPSIRLKNSLDLPQAISEFESLNELRGIAKKNQIWKSYLGMGYHGTITPPVIQRTILENPGWYTQYTPYQAEISQGRLEALLNFQTMISDLTGLPIANASLLDEATACAEAMAMSLAIARSKNAALANPVYVVSKHCHPQTISVLQTRAEPLGVQVSVTDIKEATLTTANCFGILLQYPHSTGEVVDDAALIKSAHEKNLIVTMSCDIMALTVLKSPGALDADIAVGSSQRFGVPMGYGGPHAAFMSTKDVYKRLIPGRIVGLSVDTEGKPAARLALQTREQHIRREKATSNICTAQVLLAIISGMYATYHGPKGLRKIAERIHTLAKTFSLAIENLGYTVVSKSFFDTVHFKVSEKDFSTIKNKLNNFRINVRTLGGGEISVAFDEATTTADLHLLLEAFSKSNATSQIATLVTSCAAQAATTQAIGPSLQRGDNYLKHTVFNKYHSETELLRYVYRLQSKDLSLTTSMIALGSCTMKLNAASEMFAVTWPEFNSIHPFVPREQAEGYGVIFKQLEAWLSEITGFDAISLQPNAGSQGEYAGLLAIRNYHLSRGDSHRNVCLIPKSAHGTNPASAVMVGMNVVIVECDQNGNVDLTDLKQKASAHSANLACAMITYPSTHGVFEEGIQEFCRIVHEHGGQVYMDGANMNAQVGLCRPADFGPDVCHLNLHKTFCIPHGGGGPGMGPIGVKAHLKAFLPGHSVLSPQNKSDAPHYEATPVGKTNAVSAAPWGSSSILPISWAYIRMMGSDGLTKATTAAILNANYIAKKLEPHYPVLYKGHHGFVAHECIIDLRKIKDQTGVDVEDVAKRLMDYGFHAPTVSFPVAGTMMIEPTESESLEELDRFCEAMIMIRAEITAIEKNLSDRTNNPLKNAPHTSSQVVSSDWNRPYTRELAAFPTKWQHIHKFWPPVSRINGALGDRNLICSCPSTETYS